MGRGLLDRLSQRTWKTLEDVGRRGWKMWGSLAKSLGRRVFDLKKKKSFFFFFKFENHVFQAISRGFPTSSSNVFQRLPTSSICLETICGDGITKPYICAWRHPSSNSQGRNATHKTIQIQRSSCDVIFWPPPGGGPAEPFLGGVQHQVGPRGRRCDPDVAGVSRVGESPKAITRPIGWVRGIPLNYR